MINIFFSRPALTALATICVLLLTSGLTARADTAELAQSLRPFTDLLQGRPGAAAEVELSWDGEEEMGNVVFALLAEDEWIIRLFYTDYEMILHYEDNQASMFLPRREVRFIGTGENEPGDSLRPRGLLGRLISSDSQLKAYSALLSQTQPEALAMMLTMLAGGQYEGNQSWRLTALDDAGMRFSQAEDGAPRMHINFEGVHGRLRLRVADSVRRQILDGLGDYDAQEVSLAEMERVVVRGIRRATEVMMPGPALRNPSQRPKRAANGRLEWVDGQRVVRLWGTPEEIGTAHGELLQAEASRCVDSALHMVGLGETIHSGKWFPDTLREIISRTEEFIPEHHTRELDAMSERAGINQEAARLANVFPEFFHCSGFALFGEATADGTLYHGRVLDYMTGVGLEHSNTVFFVEPDEGYNFVNVGYAGFIGSVTGMNENQISLGEMGGHGRGDWDGVPMATLMRRALEEAENLEDVRQLWEHSPRTCEYFYVFADAKIPSAAGVAATPDRIDFVEPGEDHDLLGEGIRDTVLLSVGHRLEKLRQRVQDNYGNFNEESAIALMDRPVAMSSNLHNVLFVPEKLRLYIAHADGVNIAAERPYVRLDADEWWGKDREY